MKWKVIYGDLTEYNSEEHKWKELPDDNFQICWFISPTGHRMQISGWDNYVLIEKENALGMYMWKDENPVDINGNPIEDAYAGYYTYREYRNDNTANDINYKPNGELPEFDESQIKKGKWLNEEVAKQIGIL